MLASTIVSLLLPLAAFAAPAAEPSLAMREAEAVGLVERGVQSCKIVNTGGRRLHCRKEPDITATIHAEFSEGTKHDFDCYAPVTGKNCYGDNWLVFLSGYFLNTEMLTRLLAPGTIVRTGDVGYRAITQTTDAALVCLFPPLC